MNAVNLDPEALAKEFASDPNISGNAPNVLSNYIPFKDDDEAKTKYKAKTQVEILAELFDITDKWPRMIGGSMFVFDPTKSDTSQRYHVLRDPPFLFSWIGAKVQTRWKNGNGLDAYGSNFSTQAHIYAAITREAIRYEGISRAPHYPPRLDQYYDVPELPPPSDEHRAFWRLMDFFCLANDTYKTLAAAFFAAPMYGGDKRPSFIIDTVDAQGSGKSTLVYKASKLYGSDVIDVSLSLLQKDPDKILGRILSTEGRKKRVAIIDNVSKLVSSDELAKWITAPTLSGRPPYGQGEETRVNDITWAITCNGAEIDTDTASRSYTIKVRKPTGDTSITMPDGTVKQWETALDAYIDENRLQLYADILDMMKTAKPRPTESRFPDFDSVVLSAVCRTDAEYEAAQRSIKADALHANADAQLGEDFTEAVERYLASVKDEISNFDPSTPTMVSNAVVKKIQSTESGKLHEVTIKELRATIKSGLAPKFSAKFSRLAAFHGDPRPESFLYGLHLIPDGATATKYQLLDLVLFNGVPRPGIARDGEIKVSTII